MGILPVDDHEADKLEACRPRSEPDWHWLEA